MLSVNILHSVLLLSLCLFAVISTLLQLSHITLATTISTRAIHNVVKVFFVRLILDWRELGYHILLYLTVNLWVITKLSQVIVLNDLKLSLVTTNLSTIGIVIVLV